MDFSRRAHLQDEQSHSINVTTVREKMRSETSFLDGALNGALLLSEQRKHWEEAANASRETAERLKKGLHEAMAWAGESEVTYVLSTECSTRFEPTNLGYIISRKTPI